MKRAVKAKKPTREKTRLYSVEASHWKEAFDKSAEVNPVPRSLDDIGLRQWCVEQAIKWPVISRGGGLQQYQTPPNHVTDPDVIGRYTKLYRWVTGKDA